TEGSRRPSSPAPDKESMASDGVKNLQRQAASISKLMVKSKSAARQRPAELRELVRCKNHLIRHLLVPNLLLETPVRRKPAKVVPQCGPLSIAKRWPIVGVGTGVERTA